jgi:hypothetical protein
LLKHKKITTLGNRGPNEGRTPRWTPQVTQNTAVNAKQAVAAATHTSQQPQQPKTSSNQRTNYRCYRCGESGHVSKYCNKGVRPSINTFGPLHDTDEEEAEKTKESKK